MAILAFVFSESENNVNMKHNAYCKYFLRLLLVFDCLVCKVYIYGYVYTVIFAAALIGPSWVLSAVHKTNRIGLGYVC